MAKTHSAVHRPFGSLRRAPAEEERDSSTHWRARGGTGQQDVETRAEVFGILTQGPAAS